LRARARFLLAVFGGCAAGEEIAGSTTDEGVGSCAISSAGARERIAVSSCVCDGVEILSGVDCCDLG